MKKYLKLPVYLACMALSVIGFGCSDDDDDPVDETDPKTEALKPVVENYVNNIVIATYNKLADATIDLQEKIEALKADKTNANLEAAANAWKDTRKHWELSEAFLFGAVADFGIDPHIDTWPLDEVQFKKLLVNKDFMEQLAGEDGDVWASQYLGISLLGFHGIENILFAEGATKDVSIITDAEMDYAVAVGGDLRNQCVRLEAAWAGLDNVTSAKQALIEEKELEIGRTSSEMSYGEEMLKAGEAGSGYRTVTAAATQILEYAFVIADEVGNVKIGTAANESASDEDKNYIESPYSYNSLEDFKDNIQSIENAYLGTAYGVSGASVSEYLAGVNADADKAVKDAIAASYAAIEKIPYPFAKNYTSAEADEAVTVIGETLANALTKAKSALLAE
ncbi:imelysin family protein [Massilibacteroides sp.]|uniref:imelysin family protein n=1 Tax=Massilibacteroides sp. TaxID=2034766 RepID=UPI002637EDC6|nr:imelysin family protein [Massilibacteroides sp.]MDD4514951.1 imelysin family protein [Massilibacteroides sp.]